MEKYMTYFIPGNTPSSKNSKQIIYRGGKNILLWSKLAQKYKKDTKEYWIKQGEKFRQECNFNNTYPLKVAFKFVRNSHRRFDYVNPLQTVLDLMVEYNWIPDDNADIIIPVFEQYEYNKENPGVIIKILN